MNDDERDAARERDTDPIGLEPPPRFVGTPPESIDGAPPYMRTLFQKLDKTHKNTDIMRADMRMVRKQFSSFREEVRFRFRSLEEQVGDLETRTEDGEFNQEQFADALHDLRLQFDDLKTSMGPYLDDGK